jgi:hypothetical protein
VSKGRAVLQIKDESDVHTTLEKEEPAKGDPEQDCLKSRTTADLSAGPRGLPRGPFMFCL